VSATVWATAGFAAHGSDQVLAQGARDTEDGCPGAPSRPVQIMSASSSEPLFPCQQANLLPGGVTQGRSLRVALVWHWYQSRRCRSATTTEYGTIHHAERSVYRYIELSCTVCNARMCKVVCNSKIRSHLCRAANACKKCQKPRCLGYLSK